MRARARAATLELLFDVVRRSVDPGHGFDRPVTLQWEFSDAPAWSVRIDNGSTAARQGLDPTADVTCAAASRTGSTWSRAAAIRGACC